MRFKYFAGIFLVIMILFSIFSANGVEAVRKKKEKGKKRTTTTTSKLAITTPFESLKTTKKSS